MNNLSPSPSIHPRGTDPRTIPDPSMFQPGSPGADWLASMTPSKTIKISTDPDRKPRAVSSTGGVVPPPSMKNLFGSGAEEPSVPSVVPSPSELQLSLLKMTEELERSRALMNERFEELQAREDLLQTTINESVQEALKDYILKNPPLQPSSEQEPLPIPKVSPVVARDSEIMLSHPIHTAIQSICSSDILDRLISRFDLPSQYVNDKREVASVFDFHIRSLERYEKLRDVFDHDPKGADLILAVHKFRSLFSSYKKDIDPQLLDWLTLLALSGQNDVLHDKVQAALEVACSVRFSDRQILFQDMMTSGVLPDVAVQPDVLNSIGAMELRDLSNLTSSCLALKSICHFVVSYCGHFDDIMTKAQDAETAFINKQYADTDDCQARFSAEQKEYNMVVVWFGADFLVPFKRARLFLKKCPMHVKKQFADDSELSVHMTWLHFKTAMALAWSVAMKKRRMKIDLGIELEEVISFSDSALDNSPIAEPLAAAPAAPPATNFTADIDDVFVDIKCKDCDGPGLFKYSTRKIQWLKDKFLENYHEPNRCPKHKALADAEPNASGNDVKPSVPVPALPITPSFSPTQTGNRFGSRRAPLTPP